MKGIEQRFPLLQIETMTTMISKLPSDLVMEILSRVPLNSLREVRLTCKQWNDLSKTHGFRKMHIGKASSAVAKQGESQMITMMNRNLYLTSILFVDGEPSFEHKGKLNEQVKVSQIYHCGGLLLCILKNDPRFLVWNPYLMEKRWIEPRNSYTPKRLDMFTYALGYEDNKEKSSRSCCVKLLRFIDYYSRAPECQFFWYEIYNFETGLLKTLDVTPHWSIFYSERVVSLKGNTYWFAAERKHGVFDDNIICFDFTKERFGQLLPLPFTLHGHCVVLSCVREEKLAVLVNQVSPNTYEVDIWITTKIEAQEVSWSKFLKVEAHLSKRNPFICQRFYIDEEKKIAMCFYGCSHSFNIIGDAGYCKQLQLLGEPVNGFSMPNVCAYVPSLLQIEEPAGRGQRKQQSELENRRFDENMSRLVQVEAIYHSDMWRLVVAEENQ